MRSDAERPDPDNPADSGRGQIDDIVRGWLHEVRYDPSHHAVYEGLTSPVGGVSPLAERLSRAGLDAWAAAAEALAGRGSAAPERGCDLLEVLHRAAVCLAVEGRHPDLFELCHEVWALGPPPAFALADALAE